MAKKKGNRKRGILATAMSWVKRGAGYTLVATGVAAIAGPPIIAAVNAAKIDPATIPRETVYSASGVNIDDGSFDSAGMGARIVRYAVGTALILGGAAFLRRFH